MNQNKDEPLKVHKLMMAVIAEVQKHQQQSAKGCHRGADEWLGLSCEHLRKWSLEGSRALVANFKSNICCRSSHLQIGVVCWETKSANLANYRPRKTWHHGSRFKHIFLAAVLCFPTMQQFVLWTPYGTEFGRWHTFRVDRRHRIDLSQAQSDLSHRHKHMPRWKISTKGLSEPEIIAICMFSFSLTTERLKISDIEAGKGQPTPQLESLVEKYFSRRFTSRVRNANKHSDAIFFYRLKNYPENWIWSTSLTGFGDDVINYLDLQREQFIWYWIHSHLGSIDAARGPALLV